MKKILGIGGIILFFLVIVALLVFKLVAPSHPQTTVTTSFPKPSASIPNPDVSGTPEEVARSCYKWYVARYALYVGALGVDKNDSNINRCFTGQLLIELTSTDENIDSDPVLSSQLYYPSWENTIYVQLVGQSVADADLEVTLGAGPESNALLVHMVREQGQWQMESVAPANAQ